MNNLDGDILYANGSNFLNGHFFTLQDGSMWNAYFMRIPLVFLDLEDEEGFRIPFFERYWK